MFSCLGHCQKLRNALVYLGLYKSERSILLEVFESKNFLNCKLS